MTATPQQATSRVRRQSVGRAVVPVVLAAALVWQAQRFDAATSGVYDETIYLHSALRAFHHGDFRDLVDRGIAPLPVLLVYWLPAQWHTADDLSPDEYVKAIRLARLAHVLLVGVPLLVVCYAWIGKRRGYVAAGAAGCLLACSPNIVAYSSVATTDACFALFWIVALAAVARYVRDSTRRAFALVCAGVTGAMSAKYSAVLVLPVVFVAFAAVRRRAERTCGALAAWRRAILYGLAATVGVTAIALLVVWALQAFTWRPLLNENFPDPRWAGPTVEQAMVIGRTVPVPGVLAGIVGQLLHARRGQSAFLMGERSTRGWWYYYPLAFLFKSTPVELALAAALPLLLWFARGRIDSTLALWLLSMAVFGVGCLISSLDLGIRYALVLYPLLVLAATDLAWVVPGRRQWIRLAVTGALVAVQAGSAVAVSPRYLSYFNRLLTPPGAGHTRLADSNLDWGQDLPALKREMDRLRTGRIALAYFGSAPPEAYGIDAISWTSDDPRLAECEWLAVSASSLVGVLLRGDPFSALRKVKPDARAADTLFLYDLRRPEARAAFESARQRLFARRS